MFEFKNKFVHNLLSLNIIFYLLENNYEQIESINNDKDKNKNTVTLLTPTGVVNVKIYKNQFAIYDKQLSQKGEDGKKHVIEASWFARGTKLMVQGIRRGDDFIPKKSKKSIFPIISKITDIGKNGELSFQYEREGG